MAQRSPDADPVKTFSETLGDVISEAFHAHKQKQGKMREKTTASKSTCSKAAL